MLRRFKRTEECSRGVDGGARRQTHVAAEVPAGRIDESTIDLLRMFMARFVHDGRLLYGSDREAACHGALERDERPLTSAATDTALISGSSMNEQPDENLQEDSPIAGRLTLHPNRNRARARDSPTVLCNERMRARLDCTHALRQIGLEDEVRGHGTTMSVSRMRKTRSPLLQRKLAPGLVPDLLEHGPRREVVERAVTKVRDHGRKETRAQASAGERSSIERVERGGRMGVDLCQEGQTARVQVRVESPRAHGTDVNSSAIGRCTGEPQHG